MTIERIKSFKEFDSFIVAVGRLNNEIKQFDKLIEAYNKSLLQNRVGLLIFGKGNMTERLIDELELANHVKLRLF